MKTPLLTLLAAIPLALGCHFTASISFDTGFAEEDFTTSTPFADAESLTIDWQSGSITVRIDESATEIVATGTMTAIADTDSAAAQALDDLQIAFNDDAAGVILRFQIPDDTLSIVVADVEVTLPAGITLDITNRAGRVVVNGNANATSVNVSNGSVTIEDQYGDVLVDTTNGSVSIGSLNGNVTATTRNGSIHVTARPGSEFNVSAETTNGVISILVPPDTAAGLSLHTALGITNFSLADFTVTNLEVAFNDVTATLNGGGGQISAETVTGVITFSSF